MTLNDLKQQNRVFFTEFTFVRSGHALLSRVPFALAGLSCTASYYACTAYTL